MFLQQRMKNSQFFQCQISALTQIERTMLLVQGKHTQQTALMTLSPDEFGASESRQLNHS